MNPVTAVAQKNGLKVIAYSGEHKILLAMSVDEGVVGQGATSLAGFAIWRRVGGGTEQILSNRVGFTAGVSTDTTAETRRWTPSDRAPFQKFRWVDVPPEGFDTSITYRVKALYFGGLGTALKDGPEVTVIAQPANAHHTSFFVAFTRGYIASQAYIDKFNNADIRPKAPKAPDFPTAPFLPQYTWLGAGARKALFDFLAECEADKSAKVDVFAYDLDEPDIVAAICRFGRERRLRAVLDNAPLHVKPKKDGSKPAEVRSAVLIKAAAGPANVKQGHFSRFQHNKVFLKRNAGGQPVKVLFGSMNFSLRGLYVQANNVVVVTDPTVAGMFGKAFDNAFANNLSTAAFSRDPVASGFMVGSATNTPSLPKLSVALSPHADSKVSLGPMSARIQAATSSVLFAVMEPQGSGPVLGALATIAGTPTVFSYGTVETNTGLAVQSPNGQMGAVTSYATLQKNVPAPFRQEFSGGPGIHIHDKFVVVDFNADNPIVFTGSSNLAAGGEVSNGDSLVRIEDPGVASMYAIEAVALFDHYHFRSVMQKTPSTTPFTLWYPGKSGAPTPWWTDYYDKTKIQFRDRCLFAGVALPPGVASTKSVNWTSGVPESAKGAGKPKTARSIRQPARRSKA